MPAAQAGFDAGISPERVKGRGGQRTRSSKSAAEQDEESVDEGLGRAVADTLARMEWKNEMTWPARGGRASGRTGSRC